MKEEFVYDAIDIRELYNLKARSADARISLNWNEFDELARRAIRDAEREEQDAQP